MRAPLASVLALALLASAAAPAGADEAPSAKERAAIARSAKTPARCLVIRVSSVSGRYGSYRYDRTAGGSCTRYAADGIAIVRRSGTRWPQRYAGSDCRTPPRRTVPPAVWRDLSRTFCER